MMAQRNWEDRIQGEPLTSRSPSQAQNPVPKGEGRGPESLPPPAGEEISEYFIELLIDSLQQLDAAVQGAFLQKFLKSLASVDISEDQSLTHWQEVLSRRQELSSRLGRPVSLRTAAVDYFGTGLILRNPILLEYRELKQLRRNAATDSLTGLYNRRLFDEYLTKELNRSRRYSYPLTLLLFDLRNFKRANDTYGHAIGDEVLRSLARAATETIRGSDYPCRVGGDEFSIILPQSEAQSAHALAQRIVQKFEEYALPLAPEAELGLDYGVASYPEDGDSAAGLFEAADRTLYDYKRKQKVETPAETPAETKAPATVEPAAVEAPSFPPPPSPLPVESEEFVAVTAEPPTHQRRYERVSLANTNAYGVLRSVIRSKEARVLDLSFGGISFLLDEAFELPETFHARLHVPILPVAEYKLRRVYAQNLPKGQLRLGCSFTS